MSTPVIMSASVINDLGVEVSTARDIDMTHVLCIMSATGLVFDHTEYSVTDNHVLDADYACLYMSDWCTPAPGKPPLVDYLTIVCPIYRHAYDTLQTKLRLSAQ